MAARSTLPSPQQKLCPAGDCLVPLLAAMQPASQRSQIGRAVSTDVDGTCTCTCADPNYTPPSPRTRVADMRSSSLPLHEACTRGNSPDPR